MSTNAGVWIDHEHAVIVFFGDPSRKITKFKSVARQLAETTPLRTRKSSTTKNDFVPEDRRDRKTAADGKRLFDEVIMVLSNVESLLILGPGEAKGEFRKRLRGRKLKTKIVELQTADKMTDRQLTSHVRTFFEKAKLSPVLKSERHAGATPTRSARAKK